MKSTVERTDIKEWLNILGTKLLIGVYILQDGKFCYVNPNFPLITGYASDELIGKDSLELVVPEDREMVRENAIKMLKGKLLSPYYFRVICKDGSIKWLMETVSSIQYRGRRATLGNYMEITERKQTEEALRESEERYEELANSITDIFFAMDNQLRYIYWNKASEILTGIRAEDALGKSLLEIFPDTPGLRNAEKAYRNVLKTQQPQTFVNDFDIDGRHYIFEISAYPSQSGISVFVRDITEHKQVEEKLRETEERYRALFDSSLEGVYINDFEGNFLDANETALKLLGYQREDIPHLNFASLLSPDQLPTALATLQELKDTGVQRQVNEFRLRRKDGSFVDVEVIAAIIYRNGKPYAIQGVGSDVTERKQAVERLREAEKEKSAFLEEAPVAIIHADLDGKITYVNRRFELESGYSREEIIDKSGLQLGWFSTDTTKYLAERMAARLSGSPAKHWETQFKCKDGRLIWIELEGKIISKLGVPVGFQIISNNVTERKQAEEALRLSEENYRALFESAVIGTIVIDAEIMKIELANQAAANIFGFSSVEEVIGEHVLDYVSPEEKERVIKLIVKDLFEQDLRTTVELRAITKDGRKIWISATGAKIIQGNKLKGLISFTDIMERKQAEQELEESEARFRDIFENANDGILVAELETKKFLTANKEMCRMLGYSLDEVRNLGVPDIHPEKDLPYVLGQFEKQSRGEIALSVDIPVKRKDGSVFYADVNAFALQFGQKKYMSGFFRDTSERKRAQEALQQSEENYRTLFDSSVIGTVVLNAETMKIVMVNQAVLKIFGFSSVEEVLAVEPFEFIIPEDRKRYLEIAKKALFEQKSHESYDLRAVTRDGREIWINTRATRITHNGRLAGLISFADITEQKKQTEHLMITNRLASVGELAAGAAHEINNPLTSVLGYTQLLMEKDIPDYVRKDLAFIKNEAQRAVNVTNDLLVFARKHIPKKQLYQINNIVEGVLKLRAYGLQSNNIEVVKHLDPDLPEIMVDNFQMRQVFLNIVINAEYFMTEAHKRGTLTITTEKQNSSVRISFADDGPGISPENLNRIFDPFFTTKDVGKGTGLGLSICHGIVVEHHGQIYAKSQLGEGTTIFIELPINSSDHIESIQ